MKLEFIAWNIQYKYIYIYKISSVQSLSRVRLFATPWTAAHQASQSINQFPEITQTRVHQVGDDI